MKLRLSVAALAVAFFAQGASASDTLIVHGMAPSFGNDAVQRQVAIQMDDVDPTQPAGATTLMARIQRAADAVCTSALRGNPDRYADKIAACRTKVIAQAVRDVGAPALETVAANSK